MGTANRVFNLVDVEADIADALAKAPPIRDRGHITYAPPEARLPLIAPMPDYAVHRDGVGQVGKLSAEAVVREYEAAAKEIEAMGTELIERVRQCEDMVRDALAVIEEMKATAARYREEAKRVFLQIEDCSLMTAEVRKICGALKDRITGASS